MLTGEAAALPDEAALAARVAECVKCACRPSLRRTINGTGVILHTNLGRACLAEAAAAAVAEVARGYSTLEYDVLTGGRGERYSHVEALLTALTGAEAAFVVNNNAAAVLLILSLIHISRFFKEAERFFQTVNAGQVWRAGFKTVRQVIRQVFAV